MQQGRLARAIAWIGGFIAAVSLAFGLLKVLFGDWDSTGDRIIFAFLVAGGGALIVLGLLVFGRRPWAGAGLVSAGALASALGLFWTLVLPLLALALVALSFIQARELARVPQPTASRP